MLHSAFLKLELFEHGRRDESMKVNLIDHARNQKGRTEI